ncbi:MAG: hypothetical protein EA376_13045 [Phycisphaeraceae bacterium]|nr:MAG: hypothetical protein EA376_13045 [Phycisphaeraceae bacterium]
MIVALTRRRRELLGRVRPRTPEQLHAWLRLVHDLDVPRSPLAEGSSAPFDYLVHTFFEGRFAPPGSSRTADCVVWACRGGGKTFLGAVATMLDLVFKPGIEVRILGGSLEQSGRMHAHLRALFSAAHMAGLVEGRITERRVRLRNGSVAEVLAQSATSVRGARPQKLRCDEVELFDPDIWAAAQLAPRSKRCGGIFVRGAVECLSTMHEPHGLMAEIVSSCAGGASEPEYEPEAQARDPGAQATHPETHATIKESPRSRFGLVGAHAPRRLFRWGVVDVLERCAPERPCEPCELLPECAGRAKGASGHIGIDDAIALKGRSGEEAWRSEMLCERPRRSHLVLPEFEREIHIGAFEAPDEGMWIMGMDFGVRSPTVALWAHVDAEGVLRVVDERIERGAALERHIRAILESPWPKPTWIGADPAGRQRGVQTATSAKEMLQRAGLRVKDRRASLEEGLRLVRARLGPASGSPRLFIHARCTGLIESIERYHYPRNRPDSIEPVKDGADHAVDALRYMILNLDRAGSGTIRRYA